MDSSLDLDCLIISDNLEIQKSLMDLALKCNGITDNFNSKILYIRLYTRRLKFGSFS